MRWLAGRAVEAGADIAHQTSFVRRTHNGFDLGDAGTTRFIVGADGPNSRVAQVLGLGRNGKFLFGVEHEYCDVELADPTGCTASSTGVSRPATSVDRCWRRRRSGGPGRPRAVRTPHGD